MGRKQKEQIAERITADQVLHAISKSAVCENSFFTTYVRSGPSWATKDYFELDGLAIRRSWSRFAISIFEVKVNRSDFLRDSKWSDYRNYCNRLYLACPEGLIKLEEVPSDVGLLWYTKAKNIRVVRNAAHREIEVPWKFLALILFSHVQNDRHPFFTDKREYFESWLKHRTLDVQLGYKVSQGLQEAIKEARESADKANLRVVNLEAELVEFKELQKCLEQNGISTRWPYSWKRDLEARLKGGVNESLAGVAYRLKSNVEDLLRMLPTEKQEKPTNEGEDARDAWKV